MNDDHKIQIIVALIGAVATILAAIIGVAFSNNKVKVEIEGYEEQLILLRQILAEISPASSGLEAQVSDLEREISEVKDLAETDTKKAKSSLEQDKAQWDETISGLKTEIIQVRKAQVSTLLTSFSDQLAQQQQRIDALREWESANPDAPIKSPELNRALSELQTQMDALANSVQGDQPTDVDLSELLNGWTNELSALETEISDLEQSIDQALSNTTVKLTSLRAFRRTGASRANEIISDPPTRMADSQISNMDQTFDSLITVWRNSSIDFILGCQYRSFSATICASKEFWNAGESSQALRVMQKARITVSKINKDGEIEELYNSGEIKYDFLPQEIRSLDVSDAEYLRVAYRTGSSYGDIGPSVIIGNPLLTYQ